MAALDAQWPSDVTTYERKRELLDELIRARIQPVQRYAFSFTTGEGRYLPGTTVEESSGYIVDETGRVFFFWFGWDTDTQAPGLIRWRQEAPASNWEQDAEYRQARERVGLA